MGHRNNWEQKADDAFAEKLGHPTRRPADYWGRRSEGKTIAGHFRLGGRESWCTDQRLHRDRRQRVGYSCSRTEKRARGGHPVRRLQSGRTGAGWGIPCVLRSSGYAYAHRRRGHLWGVIVKNAFFATAIRPKFQVRNETSWSLFPQAEHWSSK